MLKNQKRKVGIAVLSALTLGCAVTAGVLADNNATQVNADAPTTFAMVDGASVRLDTEQYGLRFSAEIGAAYTENANVSYHMMIIPVKWIEKYGLSGADFNGDYMTTLQSKLKAEAEAGQGLGEDGKTQRTIATVDCTPKYIENATAYYKANTWYISGSLTSIKYGNLNGDFFGLAYSLDNNGTVEDTSDDSYTYATFTAGKNERNAVYVASAAYQSGEFSEGSAEQGILFKLVNQGLHSANGDGERTKDEAYAFNPGLESKKYILKGAQYQLKVSGVPANAKLKAVWKSADHSVATVDENGLVTAGDKEGSTSVSCEVFGKKISCLVEVGDKKSETHELGDCVLNSIDVSERDFEQSGIVGEVSGVTIGTTALESTAYSYAEGKLTIPYETIKAYYGENVSIKASTENKDYEWIANIITLSISEAAQFLPVGDTNMNLLQILGGMSLNSADTNFNIYRGYFVLENDIDFEGETISNNKTSQKQDKGLTNGIFDGRGYTISNFSLSNASSFFRDVARTSVVKNVNFENVTQEKTGGGLIGYYMSGTLQNVTASINLNDVSFAGALGCSAFVLSLNDCVFTIKANESLSDSGMLFNHSMNNGKDVKLNDVTVFTNRASNLIGNSVASGYSDKWTNVKSVPTVWGNDSAKAGKAYTAEISDAAKVVWDGVDITSECDITATNVTVPAEKITAGLHEIELIGDTEAKFLTVTASYEVEEKTEKVDFSLYKTEKNGETGKVSWSAQAFEYAIEGASVTATIDGADASSYLAENKLVIPVDKIPDYYGAKTVQIETTTHRYVLNVTFATLFITDAYQLMSDEYNHSPIQYIGGLTLQKFGNGTYQYNEGTTTINSLIADSRYYGYFVLANDIDFGGKQIAVAVSQKAQNMTSGRYCGFTGTFEGNGYTISNFTIRNGFSFFGGVSRESTIKNLDFKNVISESEYGIMGYGGGMWSDVYFEVLAKQRGVLGYATADLVLLADCVFVVKAETAVSSGVVFSGMMFAKCTSLKDVTVITNVTTDPFCGVSGENPPVTCAQGGFVNVNVYSADFVDTETIAVTDGAEVYLDGMKLEKDKDYTVANDGVVTLLNVTTGTHTVSVVSATTENATTKVNEGTATMYTVIVE